MDEVDSANDVNELEFPAHVEEIHIESDHEKFLYDEFELKKVDALDDYPFNAVGRLEIFGEDSVPKGMWKLAGTGTLIS